MQRRGLCGTVEGAPHRLPIDGNNPLAASANLFMKPRNQALKRAGSSSRKMRLKCRGRNAVRQGQEFLQKIPLRAAKQRMSAHVSPPHRTVHKAIISTSCSRWRLALPSAGPQAELRDRAPDIIAIDGKTSWRTHARRNGREPLHLVSAWAARQRSFSARRPSTTSPTRSSPFRCCWSGWN